MPSLNGAAAPSSPSREPRKSGPSLIPGFLASLACVLAAGEAHATPIPTQITYSTSAESEFQKNSEGGVVFEFQPVTNGVASPGSLVRVGAILVHPQPSGDPASHNDATTSFDNMFLRLAFSLTSVNGEPVDGPGAAVSFYSLLSGSVYGDGSVNAALATFTEFAGDDVIRAGGVSLALKPLGNWVVPLRTSSNEESIVAVDVYARLEGAPVPEPSVLLIFAAAAGLGWKRLRALKSNES